MSIFKVFFKNLPLCVKYTGVFPACVFMSTCAPGACGSKKRVLHPLELDYSLLKAAMWCQELKPSPLEGQPVRFPS